MKIKLTHVISLSALLAVSACSTTSEPSEEMKKITNQQSQINRLKAQQYTLKVQVKNLKKMQPELDRLIELEGELNAMILQQKEQAQANKLKMIEEKRKMREARPFFMMQIASLNNLDNLKKTWETQQEQHPEMLNGLPARYQKVEVRGREYYRLKVGEFNNKGQAAEACEVLLNQSANCIVVNNKGIKL